ncbi:MAG TPA: alanine:cation symporter family protein [Candidatus Anaerobutyricum faecale]|uniref:alanine/glycine:cation symporter family protein n=1 Tax=Eubacterium sp. An11 TaxID=1965542 RepID=UPI000B388378|nr:alanine/glycine:cation symporter family protein [Eubacterium sp. An11]OUQ65638.1 amino acid carrier protein [Eubacterium sp. An11]HJC31175.1 alanine:cation symporter family protein [Candidatus Anaerobutyricum faecale]
MTRIIETVYNFLWGDLFFLPLPGGGTLPLSILVILLIPTGIYFTIRTKVLPVRLFKDMVGAVLGKKDEKNSALSVLQTLIVSTATRVGMGNLVGVVAAISAGGAGAVFWMWITAIIGSSTAFIEATLAQLYKEKDPLYGGWRGGPAYYIHRYFEERSGKKRRYVPLSVLFALSGLICWFGISQVVSNSVTSAFENAFHIPPLYTTIVLVILGAVIVLRKNATVRVLDIMVPIMAGIYLLMTIILIIINIQMLPSVFGRIFSEAFGLRQVAAGGFGAVIMNGVKRGLFSNEAGSGSAPCAAATAETDHPAKVGLSQALGVFIDTILICSCTAMIMLLTPEKLTTGLQGMDLLQTSMQYHLGEFGVIFIAVIIFLFSFSTFIGILFYARSNVAYLFGDNWTSQTIYKILALVMLFIGGLAAYSVVWDLGDVGVGLMTVFNIFMLYPLSKKALAALKDYESKKEK